MSIGMFHALTHSKLFALVPRLAKKEQVSGSSQVILMLCHAVTGAVRKEFRRLSKTATFADDCMILFHEKPEHGCCPAQLRNYVFSDGSLAKLPYKWLFDAKVVPGSAHFPLMEFFGRFPDYKYYWLVEGDVKFSGNWKRFFEAFATSHADFVACHIRRYAEDPEWYWWPTLSNPAQEIPVNERLASFNPIYRISKRALEYLHQKHCEGWCGHNEVLIPTLLFHAGFRLQDIGGCGQFVVAGYQNRFYTTKTFRHAPPFRRVGWGKNKLYHPVKCPLNVS
jgi:hypothetical protein